MAAIKIDLSVDGLEGQWIEVANLAQRSPNQFLKTQELYLSGTDEGTRAFIGDVVTAWNVTNPATGQPLPPPNSTALDIGDLPLIAGKRFSENVQQQLAGVLPKAV